MVLHGRFQGHADEIASMLVSEQKRRASESPLSFPDEAPKRIKADEHRRARFVRAAAEHLLGHLRELKPAFVPALRLQEAVGVDPELLDESSFDLFRGEQSMFRER